MHSKGFSLVWLRKWRFRCSGLRNVLWQIEHLVWPLTDELSSISRPWLAPPGLAVASASCGSEASVVDCYSMIASRLTGLRGGGDERLETWGWVTERTASTLAGIALFRGHTVSWTTESKSTRKWHYSAMHQDRET